MPKIIREPKPVTARQKTVYKFILKHLKEECTLPTIKEISDELGTKHPNASHQHIQALIRKGWLKKASSKKRLANYKPVFIDIDVTHKKEITVIKTQAKKKTKT